MSVDSSGSDSSTEESSSMTSMTTSSSTTVSTLLVASTSESDTRPSFQTRSSRKSSIKLQNKIPVLSAIKRAEHLQKFDVFSVNSSVVEPKSLNSKPSEVPAWFDVASKNVSLDQIPFTSVVHATDSNFARVSHYGYTVTDLCFQALFMFDLKKVPLSLRKYLMVFTDLLFHSPALVEGQQLTDKQVADLFTKEMMEKSCDMGFLNQYLHFFHLYLEVSVFHNLYILFLDAR